MRRTPPGWPPLAVLAALMVVAAVVVMHAGRDTTFYFDDWNFVTQRSGWRPYIFLYPHNEHLSLLPVFIYKVLLETVGMDAYGVFRAVHTGFNLACGALLFAYVRPRLGAWPAVALAAGLMMAGAAAYDLIWPFQMGYLGSLATGIGALVALDRRSRGGDIAACILTLASISSSSIGVAVLAAIALDVTLRAGRVRRAWIWLVPALLYGAWYLKYGHGTAHWDKITQAPQRFWEALPTAIGALTGLSTGLAQTAAFVLLVAIAAELGRRHDWNRRVLTGLALTAGFWTLTTLGRPDLPVTEMRYVYPAAVFVAILAADALWRHRLPDRQGIVVAAIFAVGVISSAAAISPYGDSWRVYAFDTKASLTAADIIGPERVHPEVRPDPRQPQLLYGRYRIAAEKYESTPAWSEPELRRLSEGERAGVDAALLRLHGAAPQTVERRPAGADCSRHAGGAPATVRGSGVHVEAGAKDVELRIHRYAANPPGEVSSTLRRGTAQQVTIPPDSSDVPWSFAAQSEAPFVLCRLA